MKGGEGKEIRKEESKEVENKDLIERKKKKQKKERIKD